MGRRTVLFSVGAGTLAVACAAGGVLWKGYHDDRVATDQARAAATAFAHDWQTGRLADASYAGTTGKAAAASFATATAALGKGPVKTRVTGVARQGDTASATVHVSWTLAGGQVFSWNDPITLVKQQAGWAVKVPGHSLWHPRLGTGDAFTLTSIPGTRGQVVGKGGAPIMTNQTVYDVLIDPVKATDQSVRQLESAVGISGLVSQLDAAKRSGSAATIPVITYRAADWADRRTGIAGLTGIVVSKRTEPLAKNRDFLQPVLGRVGPVTAQLLKSDPNYYRPGMFVGTSGLQYQYQKTLAGKPGVTVASTKHPQRVLFHQDPTTGRTLHLTIDPRVQDAAQHALDSLGGQASALVALDVKTGNILAVANGPTYGIERALTGRFAPGSTLKMATTYAWLLHGNKPSQPVDCPVHINAGGQIIGNFENEHYPNPPFRKDFAVSCNTAFVKAALTLGDSDLHNAAKALGIGAGWGDQVGYAGAYDGSVPITTAPNVKAVSAFGQGKTQASPLALATAAATIARGSFIPPALVTSPAPKGSRAAKPLQPQAAAQLKQLMRTPVTDPNGTATVMQGTPGGPVYAKTGTAEYVDSNGQPASHAWLAGWQGNIAFCALVVKVPSGKSGGTVAAPVVKDFFTTLANNPG